MRLIIRQYLAALNERDELDAILPDLLGQLGLIVYSRPGRGTRQDGVDVAAVGKLGKEPEKVYLFSIKAGDLTRTDWSGNTLQALRPSLEEIFDAYIPHRLPPEHKGKKIVICLCFGGDIKEQVALQVNGFIAKHSTNQISFEIWNGDKLAELIQNNFLREELLPDNARSQLRKALALVDEPDASYSFFAELVSNLANIKSSKRKDQVTAIRQISICLWIHFSWAREAGNIESSYLASELALLYGWELIKNHAGKKTKTAKAMLDAFSSIANAYRMVSFHFLEHKVIPFVDKRHALSFAVHPSCDLDVNLRLFDILGRLALGGIWTYSILQNVPEDDMASKEAIIEELKTYVTNIKKLIANNPVLLLPIKDEQAIEISLASLLLLLDGESNDFLSKWFHEMMQRVEISLRGGGRYPCNIQSYTELLDHPRPDDAYLKENTAGSILYPMIGLVASLIGDNNLYSQVNSLKKTKLEHCNFQLWFPDEDSEKYIYTNTIQHGAALSEINVDQPLEEFASQIFSECEQSPYFQQLSATQYNLQPLVLVACRHYRLPMPVDLFKYLKAASSVQEK